MDELSGEREVVDTDGLGIPCPSVCWIAMICPRSPTIIGELMAAQSHKLELQNLLNQMKGIDSIVLLFFLFLCHIGSAVIKCALSLRLPAPEELQAAKAEQARLQEEIECKARAESKPALHRLRTQADPFFLSSHSSSFPLCLPFVLIPANKVH